MKLILNKQWKLWGTGYPHSAAKRKIKNTKEVKYLNQLNKKSMVSLLPTIDSDLLTPILNYDLVFDYIVKNGTDRVLINLIQDLRFS